MNGLVEHIEKDLGKIDRGWTKDANGIRLPFRVAACEGGRITDATTFVTLGLSQALLASAVSKKKIRQELLFMARCSGTNHGIPSILQQMGSDAIQHDAAYLRGQVVGPRGPLIPNTLLEAVYITLPTYFPDAFNTYEGEPDFTVVLSWVIPITGKEASFIRSEGWREFEAMMVRLKPDLININRPSMV